MPIFFLTYSNIFALCLLNQTRTALFSGSVFSFVLYCEYLPFRHHFFLYKFKKSYGNRKYIFLCYLKFNACSKTLTQKKKHNSYYKGNANKSKNACRAYVKVEGRRLNPLSFLPAVFLGAASKLFTLSLPSVFFFLNRPLFFHFFYRGLFFAPFISLPFFLYYFL